MASSGAANNGNIFPSSSSSSVSPRAVLSASSLALSFSQASPRSPRPLHQQSQQPSMAMQQQQFADAAYTRPDLAPFSSMINQMITSSTLFQSKQEPHWTDIASVSADYASQFKEKKKSPAYRALEQLSGVTEADVVRSQLLSHKDSVHLKLKSFGHSIVSL